MATCSSFRREKVYRKQSLWPQAALNAVFVIGMPFALGVMAAVLRRLFMETLTISTPWCKSGVAPRAATKRAPAGWGGGRMERRSNTVPRKAAALRAPNAGVAVLAARLPGCETRAIAALALFVAVQVADAVLTTSGLARFGPDIEANPILSFSIALFGATGALVGAKLVAIACATALHLKSHHLALAVLTVGYVFVAVLPWTWALTQ